MLYEPATTEEIATVLAAFYAGNLTPGYAINFGWKERVQRILPGPATPPGWSPEAGLLDARVDAIEALNIPAALATKANASTVGALTTRVTAVEAPLANVTFNADGSIVDTGSIPTTTTFNPDGSITTLYGTPTNRTVTTTFNADGSISEVAS